MELGQIWVKRRLIKEQDLTLRSEDDPTPRAGISTESHSRGSLRNPTIAAEGR